YREFRNRRVGPHAEADHVLDRAFPHSITRRDPRDASSQPRTFGDGELTGSLQLLPSSRLAGPDLPAEQGPGFYARRAGLMEMPFATQTSPLKHRYSEDAALTMLLYRPVHQRLPSSQNAWRDIVRGLGSGADQRNAIREYALGRAGLNFVYE